MRQRWDAKRRGGRLLSVNKRVCVRTHFRKKREKLKALFTGEEGNHGRDDGGGSGTSRAVAGRKHKYSRRLSHYPENKSSSKAPWKQMISLSVFFRMP